MVEQQKIINVTMILLLLGTLGISASSLDFKDEYYCNDRPELVYNCQGFSKYVSEYGKCLNASIPGVEVNLGNKICKSGWEKIIDNRIPQLNTSDEETENVLKNITLGIKRDKKTKSDGEEIVWTCVTNGAVPFSMQECIDGIKTVDQIESVKV